MDQSHHIQPERPSSGSTRIQPRTAALAGNSIRTISPRYRECLKNHAAATGGNVTDGCGEFMPSGEEGTLEALKCAACNCHRNFHRKDPKGDVSAISVHPMAFRPPMPPSSVHNNHWTGMVQPVKMAVGAGNASLNTDSSSDHEINFEAYNSSSGQQYMLAKKRFRTKFTAEQKDKMMSFAEKLGWRIPREDGTELQRFCDENGIKREVFKVWMHNNKNSAKKNPSES